MKNKYSKELKKGLSNKEIAKGLRQILHPALDDNDVENISICLLCHLLIEKRINGILYRWLSYDLPFKNKMDEKRIKDDLLGKITKMTFMNKYEIIRPSFSAWFKESADAISEINKLRNDFFHGKVPFKEARFKGHSINSRGAIERLFISAQDAATRLDEFDELLDSRRALAEKWARRLKKLGQPLI